MRRLRLVLGNLLSDNALKTLADRLLLEQGWLDPLELLLAADLLAYEDYEAWRMGHKPTIQGLLRAAPTDVADLLEAVGAYAAEQGLVATPVEHRGWAGVDTPLRIGDQVRLVRACALVFAPPPDRPQPDLFQDGTVPLLEQEIQRALAERRIDRAREQVARLVRQDPHHRRLRGFLRLIQVIDDPDTMVLGDRLRELLAIEPLARELLGHRDRDFLAPLWSDLAESLGGRVFEPGAPKLHASFAWARAGRWDAVCEAVEAERDWCGEPSLLLAHAEACWHRRNLEANLGAARADWMWLCWEHPLKAEQTFASSRFPDRRLAELWDRFGDLNPPLDTEDFPAWLLLQEPVTAVSLAPDSIPSDERGTAYRLLYRLVTGDDDIGLRRELSEIHPQLLRLFLAQRP
ncbi:hypothetical protein [Candidatus Thiosymbion oneisti]|uniref:hypothetical protein n=1 Tax=Candidatus Thiosymbion oneisti TaxID=589554 RepID=UPI000B802262|nr:hypothetical protein [Candidatus Thiosymbion oneisti]